MILPDDIERRNARDLGEIVEGDGGQLLRRGQLHGPIKDHPLLFRTQTHRLTFCALCGGWTCSCRKEKYSAAKSRLSLFPVTIMRATRCAETITGVIPPPGCVQWPT